MNRNSIRCNRCRFWVHARCSGVKGGLGKVKRTFICKKCGDGGVEGGMREENEENGREVKVFDGMEVVEHFCYLGDTIQRDGGCDLAVRERVRKGWVKFRELSSILCSRRLALKWRGVVYRTCVRTVMTYGCENWPMKRENEETLLRAERRMIRMICGVTVLDRERGEDLKERLGLVDDIMIGVKKSRLRWAGHVMRRDKDEGVKRAMEYKWEGKGVAGRPRRTWHEVVRKDMRDLGLCERDALNREKWRGAIRTIPANPRLRGKRQ